jgi:pyruvyltransferase
MDAGRDRIAAFWCRIPSRPNFGDALTPWLIRQISGQYPQFRWPSDGRHKFLAVGSIVGMANATSTVWGAGIMNLSDDICPMATLLAVRGPLTRARALACGAACPETYGDPALLLPRFYAARPSDRFRLGLAPHFSDMPRLRSIRSGARDLCLIDMQDPIKQVVDQIASCQIVASSSLHGLIASHAYGIPAVWVQFRPLPSGDDSKFHDYFLAMGQQPPEPVRLDYELSHLDGLEDRATLPPSAFDVEPLWQACPFRRGP